MHLRQPVLWSHCPPGASGGRGGYCLIHQYSLNGYNIVLDVDSGSVHIVDGLVYELIALIEGNRDLTDEAVIRRFSGRYAEEEIKDALEEIHELEKAGQLFAEDIYKNAVLDFKARKTVVKALCLHIAHDCNLACRYCFAEEGEYHGRRALMSFEAGRKALDFLVENSGHRRNLEVDFFGGEPLMNWEVVKDLVAYGRELEKSHDKHFRFTITTNGVLLNDEIMEFCNREMDNVVMSLDGRREVENSIISAALLRIIIWILQRMFFILRIWALTSFPWSR